MEKEYAHTTIGGNYNCSTLIEQAHVSLAFLAPVLFQFHKFPNNQCHCLYYLPHKLNG